MAHEPTHRQRLVPIGSGRLRQPSACPPALAQAASGGLRLAPAGSGNANAQRQRLAPAGSGACWPLGGVGGP